MTLEQFDLAIGLFFLAWALTCVSCGTIGALVCPRRRQA